MILYSRAYQRKKKQMEIQEMDIRTMSRSHFIYLIIVCVQLIRRGDNGLQGCATSTQIEMMRHLVLLCG